MSVLLFHSHRLPLIGCSKLLFIRMLGSSRVSVAVGVSVGVAVEVGVSVRIGLGVDVLVRGGGRDVSVGTGVLLII